MGNADTVVVGGGIVGAATAYHLARLGARPLLLEAERLAFGASGRNLGYVWLHTRRPGPELELVKWTRERLPELPEELGKDFDLRCDGGLIYFFTDAQAETMREFAVRRAADGVDVQIVDGPQARELAPVLPESVLGASYCGLDAQLNPRSYVEAFAGAAGRLGAEVREGVRVLSLILDRDRVTGVETTEGSIHAENVVLAAGAWTPGLAEAVGIRLPIRPMRLQVVETAPMPVGLSRLLYGPPAVKQYTIFQELPSFRPEDFTSEAEIRHGLALLESACQRPDGRYLLGCAMDYPGFDWQPSLAGVSLVAEGLAAALPALQGAGFSAAWAGILPFTADSLPIIGRPTGLQGLVIAAGHVFGNGAGPATGHLVAQLICGQAPSFDPEPYRLDRPVPESAGEGSIW